MNFKRVCLPAIEAECFFEICNYLLEYISLFFSRKTTKTLNEMIPLQWAIEKTEEDLDIFFTVLNKTVEVNYMDINGQTSLHYVVKKNPSNKRKMVEALIDNCADRSFVDKNGKTAYDIGQDLNQENIDYLNPSPIDTDFSHDANRCVFFKKHLTER